MNQSLHRPMKVFTTVLRKPRLVAGGSLVMLPGLAVAAGWSATESLTWLRQAMVPAQLNTALCCLLSAIVLLLLVPGRASRMRRYAAELLSATIAGIAMVGLLGKALDVNAAYGWGIVTQMAVPAAIAYFLFGTVMFIVAWRPRESDASNPTNWLVIPIGIAAVAVIVSLSLALDGHESRQISERVRAETRFARNVFENHLDSHLLALERLASRWESADGLTGQWFTLDTRRYVDDFRDYLAIGWADELGAVTVEVTDVDVAPTERLSELSPLIPHTVMSQQGDAGAVVLPQAGHDAVVAVVPLYRDGTRKGYLYGVLALKGVLSGLSQTLPTFGVSALCNGTTVIAAGDTAAAGAGRWHRAERFRSFGSDWTVEVWPTEDGLTAIRSPVFRSIVLGAAFGALVLLIAIHVTQLAARRAQTLRSVNRRLSKARAKLERLAMFDTLTGLGNRNYFVRQLELSLASAIRARQPLCLLVLDLNGFKEVNDTLGHKAGDLVLKSVAERLSGRMRTSDQTFRLGGDEFAVLLNPGTDIDGARVLADKLQQLMATPVDVNGRPQPIGVSIGIAAFPQHASTSERLLREADVAMYEAKKSGKNVAAASELGATLTMSALDDRFPMSGEPSKRAAKAS